MKIARHVRGLERERPPELVKGAIERAACRQDADDRVRLLVEENRPIENRSIAAELTDPQRVTQNHHAVLARFVFARLERAAEPRVDTENIEVMGRHASAAQ